MGVRDKFSAELKLLGSAKATINSTTAVNFDFGTPNDLDLRALSGYSPGDRLLVIVAATSAGTTDTLSVQVYDAPDNAGSIGTPAAALTDGALGGGTGDEVAFTSVVVQPNRPWLRVAVDSTGATDTFICTAMVFSVPRAGL